MNKKGQALVEFVIVLPIIIMLLFSMIDLGLILYNKNELENNLNSVIEMLDNNETEDVINKFINKNTKNNTTYRIEMDEFQEIILNREYNLITPGLNLVFSNPYKIEVRRARYVK